MVQWFDMLFVMFYCKLREVIVDSKFCKCWSDVGISVLSWEDVLIISSVLMESVCCNEKCLYSLEDVVEVLWVSKMIWVDVVDEDMGEIWLLFISVIFRVFYSFGVYFQ